MKSKMTKEKLALEIIDRLKKEYPDAGCTLDYEDAWKLLVSVRLAAQCTDARVNVVVQGLYEKYPTVHDLAQADVADIEEIVRPCGLGYQRLYEDVGRGIRRPGACRFSEAVEIAWGGKKEREFDYGRRIRKAGNCHGHTLYSAGEPDGTRRSD